MIRVQQSLKTYSKSTKRINVYTFAKMNTRWSKLKNKKKLCSGQWSKKKRKNEEVSVNIRGEMSAKLEEKSSGHWSEQTRIIDKKSSFQFAKNLFVCHEEMKERATQLSRVPLQPNPLRPNTVAVIPVRPANKRAIKSVPNPAPQCVFMGQARGQASILPSLVIHQFSKIF